MNRLRLRLQHHLHPIHLWCHLERASEHLCRFYERTLWRWVIRRLLS